MNFEINTMYVLQVIHNRFSCSIRVVVGCSMMFVSQEQIQPISMFFISVTIGLILAKSVIFWFKLHCCLNNYLYSSTNTCQFPFSYSFWFHNQIYFVKSLILIFPWNISYKLKNVKVGKIEIWSQYSFEVHKMSVWKVLCCSILF